MYSEEISIVIEDISKLATSFGIVMGGLWVYINTIRGRLYRYRLEINVNPSFVQSKTCAYLAIQIAIKNVGLSRVNIMQDGTVCYVRLMDTDKINHKSVNWRKSRQVDLFYIMQDHQWIEPGETVYDNSVLPLGNPSLGDEVYFVTARVVCTGSIYMEETEWKSTAITICNI